MSMIFSASLFFLSFAPLWISILFIDVKSIVAGGEIRAEIVSIIIIAIHALVSSFILWNELKSKPRSGEKVYKLVSCSEEKSISAEYLLSYILPLFAFDFTQWDQLVLFLIFYATLAFLCIRHNYFSVNVILEIFRYRFYSCSIENEDHVVVDKKVIARCKLELMNGTDICLSSINNEYSILRRTK
jgi:hypothetical protein